MNYFQKKVSKVTNNNIENGLSFRKARIECRKALKDTSQVAPICPVCGSLEWYEGIRSRFGDIYSHCTKCGYSELEEPCEYVELSTYW